jgi:uncharacterized protein
VERSPRQDIEGRVRALYGALAEGDERRARTFFADDVVWHVPGAGVASDSYVGQDAYFGERLRRMAPIDRWSLEIREVLVNVPAWSALVRFRLTGRRKGRQIDTTSYHMVKLGPDMRVVEAWGYVADQDALDAFFSA